MVERNNADPEGEVALELIVAAPDQDAETVNAVYISGGRDPKDIASSQIAGVARAAMLVRGPSCANLPAIGRSLTPAPHWVAVGWRDSTHACLLSGRWRLADLVGRADDSLIVSDSDGRRRVEFTPPTGDLAAYSILDFDLRVRLPAAVESADGDASVSGTTAHWEGPASLWSDSGLSASSRVIPLPQEVAPWLVGALALLIVGAGVFWPRPLTSPVASDPETTEITEEVVPEPPVVAVVPNRPVRSNGPDPDNPWRPPT